MNVLAVSRTPKTNEPGDIFKWSTLDEVVQQADVISIHCPLTKETEGLINLERLRQMKPTTFLLNTSRGPVINDKDLATALNEGIIAGAGIDVLSVEPPVDGNPLIGARNIIITPHIAWATTEARQRLMNGVLENLRAYVEGRVVNKVK